MLLAQRGEGSVNPNPLVGALIVRDDDVIAQGYHHRCGDLHAEREAFRDAEEKGVDCAGATMYVTLEPCCHQGQQPPCTEAIIEKGISRGVVGLLDPNPLVSGKGVEQLRQAGIEVDVLEQAASTVCSDIIATLIKQLKTQNRVFLKYITTGMPWVTAKWAMTLDGKIATATGDSQWITNEASRLRVHAMRDRYDAILVGIGTELHDNPSLTTRLPDGAGNNPIRIIVDSQARAPLDAHVVTDGLAKTIIAVTEAAPKERVEALQNAGVEVLACGSGSEVDLRVLMQALGKREITSVFVEGGGSIAFSLLAAGLVDKVHAFVAPKIVGGADAKTPVEGKGFQKLADAVELTGLTAETMAGDVLLTAYVKHGQETK